MNADCYEFFNGRRGEDNPVYLPCTPLQEKNGVTFAS